MRAFLNAILAFIGAESLTDEEFDSVESSSQTYDQASYDDLAAILEAREAVSTMQERLLNYYNARGAEISENDSGKSNIYAGSAIED